MEELLARIHVVAIPMRVPFRGVMVREAVLVEGPAGWGEFAPFLEYGATEASRWLGAAVEAAWDGWPPAHRDSVPINATVPAVPPDEVAGILARFPGCTTAKVKVAERGQSLAHDLDRVAAVRSVLGPSGRIRVDANGGWSVEEAAEAIGRLSPLDLEYAEQPCMTAVELRDLRILLARRAVHVPVAADESIRKAADPMRVRDLEAADVIVVKVAPLGGVRRALEIVTECGLPAVVSSALDTSVGIGAGVALAAALPRLDHACGLGTVALLGGDVAAASMVPVDGSLTVRRVAADPELLERWTAPPERAAWWRSRVDCLPRRAREEHPMTGAPEIRWAWIFLDTPGGDAERSWAFWSAVTGQELVDRRGAHDEFATLDPAEGGAWVKLQAVAQGTGGVHLDLDVDDVHAAAGHAESLGARRLGTIGDTVVVLRSPGGFVHCLTTWQGAAGQVRQGLASILDQVCLDVPRARWAAENAYWTDLTGWTWRPSDEPGFASVSGGPHLPLRILLQTLEEEQGEVRAHVDFACTDRRADVARHVAEGARVVAERSFWTVLEDPVGRVYCLTDRSPRPPVVR